MPLHGGLHQKGKDRGKERTEQQRPEQKRIVDRYRLGGDDSNQGAGGGDGRQLDGCYPVNIMVRSVVAGEQQMQGNEDGADKPEQVAIIYLQRTAGAEQEKPGSGNNRAIPDADRDPLFEEQCTDERHQHDVEAGQKTGIGCGCVEERGCLESIGAKQCQAEDHADA